MVNLVPSDRVEPTPDMGSDSLCLPSGPPVEAELLLTRACNLRCPHCCASAGSVQDGELSTGQWLRIIEQLGAAGVMTVALTGGEALLRPDFLELAQAVVDRGMNVAVASNGWYVTEEVAETLGALKRASVNISLDGPREYHDQFRGVPGSFDRALQAIRLLRAARVHVGVNFMVTESSMGLFDETVRLVAEAGARSMSVGQCGTLGRSSRDLVIPWARWEAFVKRITDRAKAGELPLPIRGLWTGGWQLYLPLKARLEDAFARHIWAKPPEVTPDCGTCPAGVFTCAIGPDGHLYPCDTMTSYDELRCGSVVDEGFEAIWQRSRLLQYIRSLNYQTFDACSGCPIGELCHGGCRGCTFGATGSLNEPDPRCPRVAARRPSGLGSATISTAMPAGEPYLYPETAVDDKAARTLGSETLQLLGVVRRFVKYRRSVIGKGDEPGVTFVYLNRSAFTILKLIAGTTSLAEAIAATASAFGVSAAQAFADIERVVSILAQGRFLPPQAAIEYVRGPNASGSEESLGAFVARQNKDGTYLVMGTSHGLVRIMNPPAVRILECVEQGRTVEDAAHALVQEFGIDLDRARQDVQAFWQEALVFLDLNK